MKSAARVSILTFHLLITFSVSGQTEVEIINKFQYEEWFQLSGDLAVLEDSIILLVANGGLYFNNFKTWLKKPSEEKYLVSYYIRPAGDILYTYLDLRSASTCLIWQYIDQDRLQTDTLSVIENSVFFVKNWGNEIYLYGLQGDNYCLFRLKPNLNLELVFKSIYPVSDFHIIDEGTILVSVKNKILSIDNETGVSILLDFDIRFEIIAFHINKQKNVIITTDKGLFLYDGMDLKLLNQNIQGNLFFNGNYYYSTDVDRNILWVFKIK